TEQAVSKAVGVFRGDFPRSATRADRRQFVNRLAGNATSVRACNAKITSCAVRESCFSNCVYP
ncbi:hypothetical protein, partial [Bradyrhizobium sp.]|uniref:hypothetical protein n=1 Tax=Bradyrhizobium sp. TaxID=376 RepID=UPI003C5AD811